MCSLMTGGYELNFIVAIDFTASNGNPCLSLHYVDPSGLPNAYQRAISEIVGVLQFYDSDRKFPVWVLEHSQLMYQYPINFNLHGSSNYGEVEGIHRIMTAYTSSRFNVSLAGPTLFRLVVTNAEQIASGAVARNKRRWSDNRPPENKRRIYHGF